MSVARWLRYVWAFPGTAVGLPIVAATLAMRGCASVRDGVVEAHGGAASWILRNGTALRGGARAMTLGHVVIGMNAKCLEETRAHERIHVRQYERWGPLFIPAYLLSSFILLLRGRDWYHENPFEKATEG